MTSSKFFGFIVSIFLVMSSVFAGFVYNENGDFSVEVNSQRDEVFNNNINSDFVLNVKNNLDESQDFSIVAPAQSGWDIDLSEDNFVLDAGESRDISLKLSANSEFDYTDNVVSPDLIKISQNNDGYSGFFEFPVEILANEKVSLKYSVNIKPLTDNLKFNTQIQRSDVSPESPLKFTINSEAVSGEQEVEITTYLAGVELKKFSDVFSVDVPYKIYQIDIPSSVDPGQYESKVTVRVLKDGGASAQEWFSSAVINVAEFSDIKVDENRGTGIFIDRVELTVSNFGNIDDVFSKELEFGFFKSLLFGTSEENYINSDNGIKYEVPLAKGEIKTIVYSFNYLALMIVGIIVVLVVGYIYVRKNSNPLAVQTQIQDVKRVEHEGIKSMKVRIGFENIKESEIDKLKIIFKMPAYLQVKDNSFSLTEPKHVMKGDTQYKLVWDFKRFEKSDTRLLAFTLVNKRGILGDVRIPDLEMDVKVNGKTRKYYKSFPIIKG